MRSHAGTEPRRAPLDKRLHDCNHAAMDTWVFGRERHPCPIALAVARLTGRWKTNILWHVYRGTRRFNALCRALPEVNRGALLRQLRALERDGLLVRHEHTGSNVRHVEYSLTARTDALVPAIVALAEWGRRFGRHEAAS